MEAVRNCKTSVNFHETTWCYNTENNHLQDSNRGNAILTIFWLLRTFLRNKFYTWRTVYPYEYAWNSHEVMTWWDFRFAQWQAETELHIMSSSVN
jgi:hypothetical protein